MSYGWDRYGSTWIWEGTVEGRDVLVEVDTAADRVGIRSSDGRELGAEVGEQALTATLLTMAEELRAAQLEGETPT